jgi:hypothetical protein
MNRRKFFLSSLSLALASALPISLLAATRASTSESSHRPLRSWRSLEDCQSSCGRRFRASGPVEVELTLSEARRAGSGPGRQFIATFDARTEAPEGLYRLEAGQDAIELFLQPVHARAGTMQAVFNLID